jgi:hypothetical protein
MGLVISKGLTLARTFDPEITAYIAAVETADGQALEPAVKTAYINFILGCKADGIWNAIKASCILAGARTFAGALVPLVGTAPTNVNGNFVSGDYDRKTGLKGNGASKYLETGRPNNADPQNSNHNAVWASEMPTVSGGIISSGAESLVVGANNIFWGPGSVGLFMRNRVNTLTTLAAAAVQWNGRLIGHARSSSGAFDAIVKGAVTSYALESQAPTSSTMRVFYRDTTNFSDARLAFYSIGESLDLALLDARVTDLINAFAAAIP